MFHKLCANRSNETGAMQFTYHKASNNEIRFKLFGLINQQCITYDAHGRVRTYAHRLKGV